MTLRPGDSMTYSRRDAFHAHPRAGLRGMGTVFEAEDRLRSSRVALKILNRLDPNDLYRFKKEFRSLQNLSHPNLVALYELISEDGHWFFC